LRIGNGTRESRIRTATPLASPTACGAWIRLVLPSTGAAVETGLAIVTADVSAEVVHVEGELRVRDPLGVITTVPYDPLTTSRLRARFDEAGDLWFDASGDGVCWTPIDGPFGFDTAVVDVELYVTRPGTSGNSTSTMDDYSL
jgi:hypothetical protein